MAERAARAGDRRPAGRGGQGFCRASRRWPKSCAAASKGLGPVTETALAAPLGLEPQAAAPALAALEADGAAMKGRYDPGVNDDEWCDRRLLARIHRYTIHRLRAEIEPVAARDFLRFLFAWQRVDEDSRMEGAGRAFAGPLDARGLRGARQGAGRRRSFRPGSRAISRLFSTPPARPGRMAWSAADPAAGRRARPIEGARPARRRSPSSSGAGSPSGRRSRRPYAAAPPSPGLGPCSTPSSATMAPCSSTRSATGRASARRGRGGAWRTRRARARDLGRLRGPSRAAHPRGKTQAARGRAAARPRPALRHRERRPLGARPPRAAGGRRDPAPRRGGRACGARAAQPLRRRVLAAPRARGRRGCRRGATCCASTGGSKAGERSAAAGSSPDSRASNSPCPRRSASCARRGAGRRPANGCRCPAPIR